jgi:hypothetical protein
MKLIKNIIKNCKGQSLVEIVVAIGLLSVVFTGSWQVLHDSFMSVYREMIGLRAHYLVIGGLEGIRSIRDEDWNAVADGTWHFEYDASGPENMVVILEQHEEVWDIYRRSIVVSSVSRDPDTGKLVIPYDINYDDPNTKLVDVIVEWDYKGVTQSDSESIYLTNWARF